MLPVYPYPNQRSSMPYFQQYHPRMETPAPDMNGDPTMCPMAYGSLPCIGNYGYPFAFHPCCNHGYFPGHQSVRPPPCPLYPPQSPFQCMGLGGYPAFPSVLPARYSPPVHCSKEQPRFECDKNVPLAYHCCGYPNHHANLKEDNGMKIEELDPDADKKGNKDSPFPIVWMPSELLKKQDDPQSDVKNQGKILDATEANGRGSQQPGFWWSQPQWNMLGGPLKQRGGDGQLPFPIFWMPSFNKPDEVEGKEPKETNIAPESGGDLTLKPHEETLGDSRRMEKIVSTREIPVRQLDRHHDEGSKNDFNEETIKGDEKTKSSANGFKIQSSSPKSGRDQPLDFKNIPLTLQPHEETLGNSCRMEKNVSIREIPVRQLDQHHEAGSKSDSIEKPIKGDGKAKSSEDGFTRLSSSTKASKLPPVCLRVDPPRRKNGSGSSRSPSPPGDKVKSQKALDDASKVSTWVCPEESNVPKNVQATKVLEGTTKSEESEKANVEGHSRKEIEAENLVNSAEPGNVGRKPEEGMPIKNEKPANKKLSPTEAAVAIQSVYRGFDVRRWEPLQKLKQITRVRDQIPDVKNRIQALESFNIVSDNEKVLIGETIMSLLLKLDAIQGLHPTIRESRKAVSRELVSLQEKLDSLLNERVSNAAPIQCFRGGDDINTEEVQNKQLEKVEAACLDSSLQLIGDGCRDEEALEHTLGGGDDLNTGEVQNKQLGKVEKACLDCSLQLIGDGCRDEEALEHTMVGNVHQGIMNRNAAMSVGPQMLEPVPSLEQVEEDNEKFKGSNVEKGEPDHHSELEHSIEIPSSASEIINLKSDFMASSGNSFTTEVDNLESAKHKKENSEFFGEGEVASNMMAHCAAESKNTQNMNWLEKQSEGEEMMADGHVMNQLEEYLEKKSRQGEPQMPPLPSGGGHNYGRVQELEDAGMVSTPSSAAGDIVDDSEEKTMLVGSTKVEGLAARENIPLAQEKQGPGETGMDQAHSFESQEVVIVALEDQKMISDKTEEGSLNHRVATKEEKLESLAVQEELSVQPNLGITEPFVGKEPIEERNDNSFHYFDASNNGMVLWGNNKLEAAEEAGNRMELAPVVNRQLVGELRELSVVEEHPPRAEQDDYNLIKENKKLREMIEKLMEAGKDQVAVISKLSGRVEDLERKLTRKKNKKLRRAIPSRSASVRSFCAKSEECALGAGVAV